MSVAAEVRGLAHIVTLNNEKALNALTLPMIRQLQAVYGGLAPRPPHSGAVVLRGAGSKAFCAGGDVVGIVNDTPPGVRKAFFYEEYRADYAVHTLQQPHVALLDGIVMGGGVGVSVHGTFRVVTEKTLFAMPETLIGLFPDVGGSYFLPRLRPKGLGRFLALTGHRLRGADVLHAGIATHFAPSERIEGIVDGLAGLPSASPVEVASVLEASGPASLPPFSLERHLPSIGSCFGDAHGVTDVLRRLDAEKSEWATETATTIRRMCPLSLLVTWALLERGASLGGLKETLAMEYVATQRCMALGEFDKGVTDVLIKKTGKPTEWRFPSIGDVPQDVIDSHFVPVEGCPSWDPARSFDEACGPSAL